jgi:hypothetical protein
LYKMIEINCQSMVQVKHVLSGSLSLSLQSLPLHPSIPLFPFPAIRESFMISSSLVDDKDSAS